MQIVYDRDDLQIARANASSPVTVVIFAGAAKQLGGKPVHDFYNSFRALSGKKDRQPNIISIIDKNVCWYNNGLTGQISRIVNDLLATQKCNKTVVLGTSMGGYGAIICAHLITRCLQTIAFGAHYSIHNTVVPFDTRSPDQRALIMSWDNVVAGSVLQPEIQYDLFYGSEDSIDRQHAHLYLDEGLASLSVRFVAGSDHNVAGFLREHGLLYPMLQAMIWDDQEAVRDALGRLPR